MMYSYFIPLVHARQGKYIFFFIINSEITARGKKKEKREKKMVPLMNVTRLP